MTALDGDKILAYCKERKLYTVTVYPSLPSTNAEARILAERGERAGCVLLAEGQTAGRGRMGRSFFSPDGSGIYMTLLLRPRFSPDRASTVTTFAAVATARAIERVAGISVSVKWVNDLFACGKKLCGILAEAALDAEGKHLSYVALGIGINVTHSSFPEELSSIATSAEDVCGRRIDRNLLVAELLSELSPLLTEKIPKGYMDEYRARNLVLGREVTVISGGERFTAFGKAIEDDGNLTVTMADGTERRIVAGDVSVRL